MTNDGTRPASTLAFRCCNNGLIFRGKEWDVCKCEKGKAFAAELDKGIADIKAGRLHRWEDVRRQG